MIFIGYFLKFIRLTTGLDDFFVKFIRYDNTIWYDKCQL